MTGSTRRKTIVLVLALAAVAMGVLYPFLFPAPPEGADRLEKALRARSALLYLLAVILLLGGMALVAAREMRSVVEEYRRQRRDNIKGLIQEMGKAVRKKGGSNGHPDE